jgi:hypothetical protein
MIQREDPGPENPVIFKIHNRVTIQHIKITNNYLKANKY